MWLQIDFTKTIKFRDLPLSKSTLKGLTENNYVEMTDIQRQSIGLALQGNNILGAAKTGSGKTLAFLIPVWIIWISLMSLTVMILNWETFVSGFRNIILQTMDKIRWFGSVNYYTNKRIGISDIWNIAKNGSVPWYISWFDYRGKGFKVWKETHGSV